MKPRESWGCIPSLVVGPNELTSNEDKAEAFMKTFFPTMAEAEEQPSPAASSEIPWHPITEREVYGSVRAAKSSTAPGEDGLPTLVWKLLWKHIGKFITPIFATSLFWAIIPKDAGGPRSWSCGNLENQNTQFQGPIARSHRSTH